MTRKLSLLLLCLFAIFATSLHAQEEGVADAIAKIAQTQAEQQERLFEHAGFKQSVSKLTLESFDESLGINQSQTRFVAARDLAAVSARLEHHWLKNRDALLTTSEAGSAISTTPASYGVTSNSVATSHAA